MLAQRRRLLPPNLNEAAVIVVTAPRSDRFRE